MMLNNANSNHPKEFEFLVQEILHLLGSEQKSKYYIEDEQQEEHYIEERLVFHGLSTSNIKSIENLARVLKFAKDLIDFLEQKYCQFPEGYYFYRDTVKRMKEYTKILDSYHKSEILSKK